MTHDGDCCRSLLGAITADFQSASAAISEVGTQLAARLPQLRALGCEGAAADVAGLQAGERDKLRTELVLQVCGTDNTGGGLCGHVLRLGTDRDRGGSP